MIHQHHHRQPGGDCVCLFLSLLLQLPRTTNFTRDNTETTVQSHWDTTKHSQNYGHIERRKYHLYLLSSRTDTPIHWESLRQSFWTEYLLYTGPVLGVYWSGEWKLNPYFKLNLSKLSKYSYLIMTRQQALDCSCPNQAAAELENWTDTIGHIIGVDTSRDKRW